MHEQPRVYARSHRLREKCGESTQGAIDSERSVDETRRETTYRGRNQETAAAATRIWISNQIEKGKNSSRL